MISSQMFNTFPALIFGALLLSFYLIFDGKLSRNGFQNPIKIDQESVLLLLGIIWGDLGTFWYQFGALLMPLDAFWVTFGALLVAFGIAFWYFLRHSVVVRYIFQMIFQVA